MQKIACVFSFKMSSWVSCQKIVFNLHKSYQLNTDLKLLNYNYSPNMTPAEILRTAEDIAHDRPDVIVIMDHKPHPLPLLQLTLPLLTKKPRIIFHVFGDFTLYYSNWEKLGKLVEGYEVDFIVASDRQKHLIDKFLPNESLCYVCPFPVDKHEFFYDPSLRNAQRKKWGLKKNDLAYVFTGRLSRQKRIHTLLRSFGEFIETTGTDRPHLFLYGVPDHIGDQFVGKWETEGEYWRKINRVYRELPEKIQERIHFMGAVPNAELKPVYQGADYLMNLSVHNDEDYGMSVAEAQCSGIPSILTDWGGLASFFHAEMPEATRYIPVHIGTENKLIDYKSIIEAYKESLEHGHNADRQKLSSLALGRFGVEAAGAIIRKIIDTPSKNFRGFSPFFKKVVERYMFTSTPYITEKKTIHKIYKEIYSSYVRDDSTAVQEQ